MQRVTFKQPNFTHHPYKGPFWIVEPTLVAALPTTGKTTLALKHPELVSDLDTFRDAELPGWSKYPRDHPQRVRAEVHAVDSFASSYRAALLGRPHIFVTNTFDRDMLHNLLGEDIWDLGVYRRMSNLLALFNARASDPTRFLGRATAQRWVKGYYTAVAQGAFSNAILLDEGEYLSDLFAFV